MTQQICPFMSYPEGHAEPCRERECRLWLRAGIYESCAFNLITDALTTLVKMPNEPIETKP